MNGTPDIIMLIGEKFIGIEVKAQKGVLSDSQKTFRRLFHENCSGQYIVIRSLDDILPYIEDWKAIKKRHFDTSVESLNNTR